MMIEDWRLLDTDLHDAYYNMALDEAISVARSKKLVPNTLRFFRWAPSSASIGYFQSMEEEVDVQKCKENGIDYIRRRTGGGAVFHDKEGELTYSLLINEDHRLISQDFQKTYEILCSGLVTGLKNLGIPAEFKVINDIIVEGKKISGNAQTRSMNVVHQHGTILREVNVSLMYSILKISDEKIRDKMIKSAEERVNSINKFLKREVNFEEIKTALKKGFEDSFKINLIQGEISRFEEKLTAKLKKDKYSSNEWNFKR